MADGTARKRRLVVAFQKHVLNPVTRPIAGILPGWVLLETTGRTSGKARRVPLGGTRDGDTFWIVSEHGRRANYVRNIESNPRVRLRIGGHWRTGSAHIVPDDDADSRRRTQSAWNRGAVKRFGTDLLTLRVDLDPR